MGEARSVVVSSKDLFPVSRLLHDGETPLVEPRWRCYGA